MKDVMLDIEACGEVVMSIGACEFDRETGAIGREFYAVLNMDSQQRAGLKMDTGAFSWWLRQSDSARRSITEPSACDPDRAIQLLREWIPKGAFVWAYPTSYDLPVIARMCAAFSLKCPWEWRRTMDARTLWQLALAVNPDLVRVESDAGIEHNALDDAKQQAGWVAAYLKAVQP